MEVYLLTKVENFVAKGEIAHFGQFLLLTQCFQKSSAADASESVNMWERIKLTHSTPNFLKWSSPMFKSGRIHCLHVMRVL